MVIDNETDDALDAVQPLIHLCKMIMRVKKLRYKIITSLSSSRTVSLR